MDIKKAFLFDISRHPDERGTMAVIEGDMDIPFEIKRIFYIYGTDSGAVRGRHANYKTEFVMICINGSVKVRIDYGHGFQQEFILDKPEKGLFIPRLLWKDMYDFSDGAVLLVLASEHYDPEEYIRSPEDYDHLKANEK